MLVRITNRCRMKCSHCMVEAHENGEHMTLSTFKKVLKFNAKFDPFAIFLSGGEPLDHPEFFKFADLTKNYMTMGKILTTCIMSNGMFLDDSELTKKAIETGLPFQITNDPEFYPKRINIIEFPNFVYEHKLRLITPMGRALKNKLETTRQNPLCFNLRSIIYSGYNFFEAVTTLRSKIKMCTPSINVDGSIVAGEAPGCYQIGTVDSSPEEILDNLKNMKCGKCGLYKNLKDVYKEYWDKFEGKNEGT